jgi:hypothetical protein
MELFDRPRIGKRPPGYLPLFDEAALADEDVRQGVVSPFERDSVLRQAGELAGGTVGRVADTLSAPGDYLRGALAGRAGERVSGRDLLKSYGIVPQEDNWGSFVAGLGVDLVTDPLSFVSGPATALTKAGRAAEAAGLLDNAATVATKKAISSGAVAAGDIPQVAKNTLGELQKTGRTLSTFDPAVVGRPLYGTRTARRAVTLDDLIQYADDPEKAAEAARRFLGDGFEAARGQRLSDSFGLGLPLGDAKITGDFLGEGFGNAYADALDTLGQKVRWSGPGRVAAAMFNNKVFGAIDPEEQLTNIANFEARRKAGSLARGSHAYNVTKLWESTPEAFTEDGNRIMGRLIETPEEAWDAADKAWLDARPGAKNYIGYWKDIRDEALDRSRKAGLSDAEAIDAYGTEYLPRRAAAALEMAGKRDKKLGDVLSAFTGDMLRRTDAFQLPGGRNTIMELSQDPVVAGAKRTAGSDEAAAQHIIDKLTPLVQPGQPPIEMKQAIKVARTLNELPDDVIKQAPLFGQHPVESIGSYLTGRAEAEATMSTMHDSLATFAARGAYSGKSRHISMQEALNRIGSKTYDDASEFITDEAGQFVRNAQEGGAQQMRERLGKLWGMDPDDIKLSEVSIPEEAVERLTRARDVYSSGEAAGALAKYLDRYTAAWRGSILTWPSRAVRDLYSGAVSNWLAGAFEPGAVGAAAGLMSDGPNSPAFRKWLASQSRYSGDDGLALFFQDLHANQLVQGNGQMYGELQASTLGNAALDPIVGARPINIGTMLGEFAPQQGRSWTQAWQDFKTWRSQLDPYVETKNPVLRAGEQMNSLTDGINRISGFMSLVGQGFDPAAAAARIKGVQADMSSLSDFERRYLKNIFPWYTYQSRIFREILKQLVERPGGRYGQILQGTENAQESNDGQYIPSSLRSQFAVPVPEMLGGRPAPGTQRYWTDLDFPGFDQINMIETPGTPSGAIYGTARQLGLQLHPAYRMGAELLSGQDFFTRRPLGESTSTLDAIGRNVTGDRSFDVPAILEKPIEALPFVGRPLYMARSLTDLRGDAPLSSRVAKTAVNALTGTKFRDVSQEEALADAIREIEGSIDPYTREFKQVYIPKDMEPEVPAWALQRQAVARGLARERRDLRKPRSERDKRKKKRKSDTQTPSLFD